MSGDHKKHFVKSTP